jgi:NifB/MoaA-like Fe-S oxidoreductase
MEIKVIKRFRDKDTKEVFAAGALYKSDDEGRITFLKNSGYLEKSEIQESVLDQNVEEIKVAITADLGKERLKELFKEEFNSKNRKGVIEHIDSLLKEE